MCLAVPAKVLTINESKSSARVEVNGVKLDVSTLLIQDLTIGSYCLVHAGYIIEKMSDEDANEKLDLFAEFYAKVGKND